MINQEWHEDIIKSLIVHFTTTLPNLYIYMDGGFDNRSKNPLWAELYIVGPNFTEHGSSTTVRVQIEFLLNVPSDTSNAYTMQQYEGLISSAFGCIQVNKRDGSNLGRFTITDSPFGEDIVTVPLGKHPEFNHLRSSVSASLEMLITS